jgi:hypothetical protein
MFNRKASLNEIDFVVRRLLEIPWVTNSFGDSYGELFSKLENITYKQKQYINILIFKKDSSKLHEVLSNIIK